MGGAVGALAAQQEACCAACDLMQLNEADLSARRGRRLLRGQKGTPNAKFQMCPCGRAQERYSDGT